MVGFLLFLVELVIGIPSWIAAGWRALARAARDLAQALHHFFARR